MLRLILLFSITAILNACGGGGSGGSSSSSLTGIFVDSPVVGINYSTASGSGKTDSSGGFKYQAGESVTFSIGNISFPSAVANSTITPLDLANTTDSNNQVATNLLVLLQSLDTDGDPTNGIQISAAAHAAATTSLDFNVTPSTFSSNSTVQSVITNSGSKNTSPISQQTAATHFQTTLASINVAPIANAGLAQSLLNNTKVTLDGSGSFDANNDTITYFWTISSQPNGSSVHLSDSTSSSPSFTPSVAGVYVASLVVNDGKLNSTPSTVTISVGNSNVAPVANAGIAQNVVVGATTSLNGSNSSDANGDSITYSWKLLTIPAGSNATLANATSVNPTFVPDIAGNYVVSLTVNDGSLSSAASTVTITASTTNIAPIANAGNSQSVVTGSTVHLDGTNSNDANGDSLTYLWTLTSKPTNSTATLSSTNATSPSFIADKNGNYVISLIVNDGSLNSKSSTVTITAATTNLAPIANAGGGLNVYIGTTVTLNGTGSYDPNGDSLVYSWAFLSKPSGSSIQLSGVNTASPTFTPDVAGSYVIALAVGDGSLVSQIATVTITASSLPVISTITLYLYGGANNSIYLGCLTCNKVQADSICNSFGTYGNSFNASSIWNQFGTYGSSFQTYSPWNSFSNNGPLIVGSNNLSYGYFTTNAFKSNRTTGQAFLNILNYYSSTNNLASTKTYACGY